MNPQIFSFNNPNLPIFVRNEISQTKGAFAPLHFHSELECNYVHKGKFVCKVGDGEFIVNQGDIILLNSKVPHETEIIEDVTELTTLIFHDYSAPQSTGTLLHFLKKTDTPVHILRKGEPETSELASYILNILKEKKEKNRAYNHYLFATIYLIIAFFHRIEFLSDEDTITRNIPLKKIMPAIEYIDKNYSEDLSLDDLSKILNISKQHFCKIFKKATGSTPTDYLNYVRICNAEALLKTDMSISEIAYAVGFSSLSYFNRVFKKNKFFSPQNYRRISSNGNILI